jgi:hypothetical protein
MRTALHHPAFNLPQPRRKDVDAGIALTHLSSHANKMTNKRARVNPCE